MSNWRLPTVEELELIWKNLHKKGLGDFAREEYWSLSWFQDFLYARFYDFKNRYTDIALKTHMYRVRAVRAFELDPIEVPREDGIDFISPVEIGGKTRTGFVFSRNKGKYIECAFEDLKVGDKTKFTWGEIENWLPSSRQKEKEVLRKVYHVTIHFKDSRFSISSVFDEEEVVCLKKRWEQGLFTKHFKDIDNVEYFLRITDIQQIIITPFRREG